MKTNKKLYNLYKKYIIALGYNQKKYTRNLVLLHAQLQTFFDGSMMQMTTKSLLQETILTESSHSI